MLLMTCIICRKLMTAGNAQHAQECEQEHETEGLLMEELGRLLGEVKASARCVACMQKHAAKPVLCVKQHWHYKEYCEIHVQSPYHVLEAMLQSHLSLPHNTLTPCSSNRGLQGS